ncbi:tetratricopeptide repeat protein [Hymenobacter monticola]|uniref:Tetratricopeptide repeat protein n=1 Tax=Hymenobacter monticola TaxID=1705399 RepID=A0ABY4BBK1_9BACT|nr:tetratricopeptide repeat protein [Hymenobacter monticola]UOE35672.1 tetratricopeptide repeat protein [Hymenobacter monticola]
MSKRLRLASLVLALGTSLAAFAQTPKQDAEVKGVNAIRLMDEGKLDEAISLLQQAQKLDPARSDYAYELGYAYYQQKKYPQALEMLAPLIKRPDASDRTFELLGNAYDDNGNPQKAIEAYEAGMRKFPASGRLPLELGIVYMGQKDYDKAIGYFESGIRVAPQFSSNYYWASKLFCSSSEEVWGMIYGELFINLEPDSKRTFEISQLLYDTYKSEIKFAGADTVKVSFSKNSMIVPAKGEKLKLPYGSMVYEPVMLMSTIGEKSVNLDALDRIRTKFVENYYRLPASKDAPNALFDYQRQIKQAGHLEAYNHWLLLAGDETGFSQWKKANPEKWNGFLGWFEGHPLQLDSKHLFYRAQYQ